MNTFEFSESLRDMLSEDAEIIELLRDSYDDIDVYGKIRQNDVSLEEFRTEDLPLLSIYFSNVEKTYNDYANLGFLLIDIYSMDRLLTGRIRKRIVELVFKNYNEVVRAEGEYQSGIRDVYKYRVVYTPLVTTKG